MRVVRVVDRVLVGRVGFLVFGGSEGEVFGAWVVVKVVVVVVVVVVSIFVDGPQNPFGKVNLGPSVIPSPGLM